MIDKHVFSDKLRNESGSIVKSIYVSVNDKTLEIERSKREKKKTTTNESMTQKVFEICSAKTNKLKITTV